MFGTLNVILKTGGSHSPSEAETGVMKHRTEKWDVGQSVDALAVTETKTSSREKWVIQGIFRRQGL